MMKACAIHGHQDEATRLNEDSRGCSRWVHHGRADFLKQGHGEASRDYSKLLKLMFEIVLRKPISTQLSAARNVKILDVVFSLH